MNRCCKFIKTKMYKIAKFGKWKPFHGRKFIKLFDMLLKLRFFSTFSCVLKSGYGNVCLSLSRNIHAKNTFLVDIVEHIPTNMF